MKKDKLQKPSTISKDTPQKQSAKLLPGVFEARKKSGEIYYRASITYQNRHISLGSFPTIMDAHQAYLEGRALLDTPEVLPYHYERFKNTLSFEKWVVLINFRENGIYFSHPIYMGQKMFYYYLNPEDILKFDLEDLFYYSSHKIMRRGNHLFVADYGSHVSIFSRYGLKPFSVLGKDYEFINGDTLDYRRENILIKNTYHGVVYNPSKKIYIARIHINGYFIIGEYDTGIKAAIAYNKTIDLLKKKGLQKAFLPNEIYEIPASQYANIYSEISISEAIQKLERR